MILRKVKQEDEKKLLGLLSESPFDCSGFNMSTLMATKSCYAFILENSKKELVGFGALSTYLIPTKGRVGKIENLFIQEKFQGKGLGGKILDKLIKTAKQKKLVNITLTSNPEKIQARNLYTKRGFEILKTDLFLLDLKSEDQLKDEK